MKYCDKAQPQKLTLHGVGHSKCLLGKSFTFKGPNSMTGTGTFVAKGYQVDGCVSIIKSLEAVYGHICDTTATHGRPQRFMHIDELDMTLEEFHSVAVKQLAKRRGSQQGGQEAAAGSTAPSAAPPSANRATAAAGTSTPRQPAAARASAPARPPTAAQDRAASHSGSASMNVPPASGKVASAAAATSPTPTPATAATPPTVAKPTAAAAAMQSTAQRSAQRQQQGVPALVATPAAGPARPLHGAHPAAGTSPPPAPLLRRQRPADAHAAATANTAGQAQLESEFQDFLRVTLLAEDHGEVQGTGRQLQGSSLPLEAFAGADPAYLINSLPDLPASGDEEDLYVEGPATVSLEQWPAPAASQLDTPAAAPAAGVTVQAQAKHRRQQQQQQPPSATPAFLAAPSTPSSATLGRRWSKFLLAAKSIPRPPTSDAADPLTAAARAVHHHRAQLLPLAGLPEKAEAMECLLDWLEQLVLLLQDDEPAAEDVQMVLESLASVASVYGIKPCAP